MSQISVQNDIYEAWKDWALLRDHLKWEAALASTGGDELAGGEALGRTFFLINDWKIFLDHAVNFEGNLFADDGSSPFVIGNNIQLVTLSTSNLVNEIKTPAKSASIFT